MSHSPRRLLLSAAAARSLGDAPQACAQAAGQALELRILEDIVEDEAQTVDAAYISRDITGRSTKHVVLAELAACYRVLRRSGRLSWVHTHSAGADRPIYAELSALGVSVTTSPGANAPSVAQSALAGLLALSRRFPMMMAAQRQHAWSPLLGTPHLPPDLSGQRVTLVGWGPVGQQLQAWLAMLGLELTVVRHRAQTAYAGTQALPTLTYEHLPSILPHTDWLLLACPLTDKTLSLIDALALSLLPAHAHLINVARGEIVDQAALCSALQDGRLAGAFLDVFEHEPLPADSSLWDLPNLMITPHCAGHSTANAARYDALFVDRLGRWLRGEALPLAL